MGANAYKELDFEYLAKTKHGALIRGENGEVFEIRGLSAEVIESTGAGDSFDAGLIYGILMGCSLKDTAKLGMLLAYLTAESWCKECCGSS